MRFVYVGVRNRTEKNGARLVDVAIANEFGTANIPPRPAFRHGAEKAILRHKKLIRAFMRNATSIKNKKNIAKLEVNFLTTLGKAVVYETKKIIQAGSEITNAPATVKKKGFNHPLKETGLLEKNLDFVVK